MSQPQSELSKNLTQHLDFGHTALIREKLGDEYFSQFHTTPDGKTEGELNINKVWEAKNQEILGIAFGGLFQELTNRLISAGSIIESLSAYFDRLDDAKITSKYEKLKQEIERGDATYKKVKEVFDAARATFPELTADDIWAENQSKPKPQPTDPDYSSQIGPWQLQDGYAHMHHALAQYETTMEKYLTMKVDIERKMKERGLTI